MKMPIVQLREGELPELLERVVDGDKAAQDRVHLALLPMAHGMAFGHGGAAGLAPELAEDARQDAAVGLARALSFCTCWRKAQAAGLDVATQFLDCATDWITSEVLGAVMQEHSHTIERAHVRHAKRVRDAQHDAETLPRMRILQSHADCPDTGPDSLEEWAAVHEQLNAYEEQVQDAAAAAA